MAERLPMPARANGVAEPALNPTEVIPGPQPLQRSGSDEARVISGEVVGAPRHRGPRVRRPGPGSVGTVVLSATGAVAGLSLLMPHSGSPDSTAAPADQPLKASAGDTAQVAPEPVAAAAAASAKSNGTARTTAASAGTDSSGTSASGTTSADSSTTGTARHARTSGTWSTGDWQEAVTRAAAAQQGQTGRHRADGGSGQFWSPTGQTGRTGQTYLTGGTWQR